MAVGRSVLVAVAVGVLLGIAVAVGGSVLVAVGIGVGVSLGWSVAVEVSLGIAVAVGWSVLVAVAVGVSLGIAVAVAGNSVAMVGRSLAGGRVSVASNVASWIGVWLGSAVAGSLPTGCAVFTALGLGWGVAVSLGWSVAVAGLHGVASASWVAGAVDEIQGGSLGLAVTRATPLIGGALVGRLTTTRVGAGGWAWRGAVVGGRGALPPLVLPPLPLLLAGLRGGIGVLVCGLVVAVGGLHGSGVAVGVRVAVPFLLAVLVGVLHGVAVIVAVAVALGRGVMVPVLVGVIGLGV